MSIGRTTGFALGLLILALSARPAEPETTRGLWLLPRKDASNTARADAPGKMPAAPSETWRISTGAEINSAALVSAGGEEALLVLAGRSLALVRPDGKTRWRLDRHAVRQVVRIDDFDADSKTEVLIFRGSRGVSLIDLETGSFLWDWNSPPSSNNILCRFIKTGKGTRLIMFPNYSTLGVCFDFSGDRRNPRTVWEKDYSAKYTKGYGPSFILADMDGDGRLEILLSSKRENPPDGKSLYQAVIDPSTGEIVGEGHIQPEAGAPLPLGRPYGFLQASDLDGDGRREIVLVSCQVEEYLLVARWAPDGGLEKVWAHFVEKDWPSDDRELRPQVTSLADVDADGRPELVVGLWDRGSWTTLVLDPLKGISLPKGRLEGVYFWGCLDIDGDGVPEIVVSPEARRRPARMTTLLAFSGKELRVSARLENAAVLGSPDSDLGDDLYFMAVRSNPVAVKSPSASDGILVKKFSGDREEGIFLWGAKPGGPVGLARIADPGFSRIDWHRGRLLLGSGRGEIHVFDECLRPRGDPVRVSGRLAVPLVWVNYGKREVVFDEAGGTIAGGVPDFKSPGGWKSGWTVDGSLPALHVDRRGQGRLAAADISNQDNPAALVYESPLETGKKPRRLPLSFPPFLGLLPFGEDFRLLVDLRTGVHTNAFACYDSEGSLIWEDRGHGAYPRLPAAGDLDGDGSWEVVADDHGDLRIYDPRGDLRGSSINKTWNPPAYLLPILGPFLPGNGTGVLGVSGFGGMTLYDSRGAVIWRKRGGDWEYFRSFGALGYLAGPGKPRLGALTETGVLQCLEASTGAAVWSLDLRCSADETSVVAGDLDGDGLDEYLTGLPDGRLVCAGERDGKGLVEWELPLDAAIGPLAVADADGDGRPEIILATGDGLIRIFK